MPNNMKLIDVIIDCGHGGINAEGVYTTAPYKMFKHSDTDIAYEGVINRWAGQLLGEALIELCVPVYYTVYPNDPTDLSLSKRVAFANAFNKDTTLFISLHSNASSSHKGEGIEIFTSIGETRSDILATYIGEELIDEFPDIKFRSDFSDEDLDKEANHYVTKNTLCPAVLLEFLFFDNPKDWALLQNPSVMKRYTWRVANGIVKYIKTLR